jgi:hypothetical protein
MAGKEFTFGCVDDGKKRGRSALGGGLEGGSGA